MATNSSILVREATPAERCHWDELVAQFEDSRVFQKQAWIQSVEAFSGAKPLYLLLEREGAIVGCFPGFLVKLGPLRIFGSPLEGWQTQSMGPAFAQDRVSTAEMFGASIPFLENQHGVHHMELTSAHLEHEAMRKFGFRGEKMFTYRVPLFPGEEDKAMKNMDRNTRNQLRKAVKLGLTANIETDESFVDEFYAQMQEVFTRHRKSVSFTRARARLMFRFMKESGKLLALSVRMPQDGACAATGIFMIDGRELHFWGWTHRAQFRWWCPSELLIWTAMQKAMQAGCVTFDMAGGGKAKVKFGALPDLRGYHWIRSRYRWLANVRESAKRGYRWQQRVRGRIASQVAAWRGR